MKTAIAKIINQEGRIIEGTEEPNVSIPLTFTRFATNHESPEKLPIPGPGFSYRFHMIQAAAPHIFGLPSEPAHKQRMKITKKQYDTCKDLLKKAGKAPHEIKAYLQEYYEYDEEQYES